MCFAAVCLGTLVDDMLRLVEIRITSIWNWGHNVVADRLIPARVRKKSEILAERRRLVTDPTLTAEAFRAKANTLLLADPPNTLPTRAADVREVLSRNARRIRPILQLLTKLRLHGDGDGGNGLSWLEGIYDDGVNTFFLDKAPVWARKDLYFRRDEAEVQPEGVEQAQNELYRKIGRIQLPTLLLELDSQVHFSWKLLSREPKSAEELLGVYGALLAAGTWNRCS